MRCRPQLRRPARRTSAHGCPRPLRGCHSTETNRSGHGHSPNRRLHRSAPSFASPAQQRPRLGRPCRRLLQRPRRSRTPCAVWLAPGERPWRTPPPSLEGHPPSAQAVRALPSFRRHGVVRRQPARPCVRCLEREAEVPTGVRPELPVSLLRADAYRGAEPTSDDIAAASTPFGVSEHGVETTLAQNTI